MSLIGLGFAEWALWNDGSWRRAAVWQINFWCNFVVRLGKPVVAIRLLLANPGRFERDLLQAIATGDDDHEVEFAILLHQASG